MSYGWSRWVLVVEPGRARRPELHEVRGNADAYGRAMFGPQFRMTLTSYADGTYTLDVLAVGHPVLDPRYVQHMTDRWRLWAMKGWGAESRVICRLATVVEAPTGSEAVKA